MCCGANSRSALAMRRIAVIVATTFVSIVMATWIAIGIDGAHARSTGWRLYVHRSVLKRIASAADAPPDVVWLGDSTSIGFPTLPSYAQIIERNLLGPAGFRSMALSY